MKERIVALLAVAIALGACKEQPKDEVVVADKKEKTKDEGGKGNGKDDGKKDGKAKPSPTPVESAPTTPSDKPVKPESPESPSLTADTKTIEGRFDRYSLAGDTFRTLLPADAEKVPTTIVLYDANTLVESSRVKLEPNLFAENYDGSVQAVITKTGLDIVAGGKHTPVPSSLIGPISPDDFPLQGSITDDGRLLGGVGLAVYDIKAMKLEHDFDEVSAGGPSPLSEVEPSGHFAIGMGRGTRRTKLKGPVGSHLAWDYSVGTFVSSADESKILEGPYMPFAMDYVETFTVEDANDGKELKKLAITLGQGKPYSMALSPKGDVAAVLTGGKIHFYTTSDGKETKSVPQGEAAAIAFSPKAHALLVVGASGKARYETGW